VEDENGDVIYRHDLTTYQEKLNVKFESYEKPRKWVYWVNDINGEWSTRLDYLL
jgi:hypothetical protein